MAAWMLRAAAGAALGVSAWLLQACAGYSPGNMPAGTPRDEAVKAMGTPTGEYRLTDGGSRVEFARGPFGKHTYMLDFDANGRLTRWQQVLTEANFNALKMGMDQQEVRMSLGRPSQQRYLSWPKLMLWSYRYDSTPFCLWFNVGIDAGGKVADLGYTPDPLCDVNDKEVRPR